MLYYVHRQFDHREKGAYMTETADLLFTQNHEWARLKRGKTIVVGISDYAQGLLSDVTGVELPEPDEQVYEASEEVGIIESLKTTLPFHAPVAGRISKINSALLSNPETINDDPHGDGWLFEMVVSNLTDLDDLMDQDTYEASFPDEEEE
jgi:glycine cleavage system H protein